MLVLTRFLRHLSTRSGAGAIGDQTPRAVYSPLAAACHDGDALLSIASIAPRSEFCAQLTLACFASLCAVGLAGVLAESPFVCEVVLDGLLASEGDAALVTFALPCAHAMSDEPPMGQMLAGASAALSPILCRLLAVADGENAACAYALLSKLRTAQTTSRSAPDVVLSKSRTRRGIGARMLRWIGRARAARTGGRSQTEWVEI